jgi:hypothetical protein
MWSEEYEQLSNNDKSEFTRLANYLMSRTYLVRDVYSQENKYMTTSSDYRTALRFFDLMREYFDFSGWNLEKDESYGVISLTTKFDYNRLRLNLFTTMFLYVCRLIYEEEREHGDNQRVVRTTTNDVIEKMVLLNLINSKTYAKDREKAQKTLAHHNIIQKVESTAWSSDGNTILILPSILSIVSNESINGMTNEIEAIKKNNAHAEMPIAAEDESEGFLEDVEDLDETDD